MTSFNDTLAEGLTSELLGIAELLHIPYLGDVERQRAHAASLRACARCLAENTGDAAVAARGADWQGSAQEAHAQLTGEVFAGAGATAQVLEQTANKLDEHADNWESIIKEIISLIIEFYEVWLAGMVLSWATGFAGTAIAEARLGVTIQRIFNVLRRGKLLLEAFGRSIQESRVALSAVGRPLKILGWYVERLPPLMRYTTEGVVGGNFAKWLDGQPLDRQTEIGLLEGNLAGIAMGFGMGNLEELAAARFKTIARFKSLITGKDIESILDEKYLYKLKAEDLTTRAAGTDSSTAPVSLAGGPAVHPPAAPGVTGHGGDPGAVPAAGQDPALTPPVAVPTPGSVTTAATVSRTGEAGTATAGEAGTAAAGARDPGAVALHPDGDPAASPAGTPPVRPDPPAASPVRPDPPAANGSAPHPNGDSGRPDPAGTAFARSDPAGTAAGHPDSSGTNGLNAHPNGTAPGRPDPAGPGAARPDPAVSAAGKPDPAVGNAVPPHLAGDGTAAPDPAAPDAGTSRPSAPDAGPTANGAATGETSTAAVPDPSASVPDPAAAPPDPAAVAGPHGTPPDPAVPVPRPSGPAPDSAVPAPRPAGRPPDPAGVPDPAGGTPAPAEARPPGSTPHPAAASERPGSPPDPGAGPHGPASDPAVASGQPGSASDPAGSVPDPAAGPHGPVADPAVAPHPAGSAPDGAVPRAGERVPAAAGTAEERLAHARALRDRLEEEQRIYSEALQRRTSLLRDIGDNTPTRAERILELRQQAAGAENLAGLPETEALARVGGRIAQAEHDVADARAAVQKAKDDLNEAVSAHNAVRRADHPDPVSREQALIASHDRVAACGEDLAHAQAAERRAQEALAQNQRLKEAVQNYHRARRDAEKLKRWETIQHDAQQRIGDLKPKVDDAFRDANLIAEHEMRRAELALADRRAEVEHAEAARRQAEDAHAAAHHEVEQARSAEDAARHRLDDAAKRAASADKDAQAARRYADEQAGRAAQKDAEAAAKEAEARARHDEAAAKEADAAAKEAAARRAAEAGDGTAADAEEAARRARAEADAARSEAERARNAAEDARAAANDADAAARQAADRAEASRRDAEAARQGIGEAKRELAQARQGTENAERVESARADELADAKRRLAEAYDAERAADGEVAAKRALVHQAHQEDDRRYSGSSSVSHPDVDAGTKLFTVQSRRETIYNELIRSTFNSAVINLTFDLTIFPNHDGWKSIAVDMTVGGLTFGGREYMRHQWRFGDTSHVPNEDRALGGPLDDPEQPGHSLKERNPAAAAMRAGRWNPSHEVAVWDPPSGKVIWRSFKDYMFGSAKVPDWVPVLGGKSIPGPRIGMFPAAHRNSAQDLPAATRSGAEMWLGAANNGFEGVVNKHIKDHLKALLGVAPAAAPQPSSPGGAAPSSGGSPTPPASSTPTPTPTPSGHMPPATPGTPAPTTPPTQSPTPTQPPPHQPTQPPVPHNPPPTPPPTLGGGYATIGPGSPTLWDIAVKVYGDGTKWVDILHANPQITDVYTIPDGTRITLPVLPNPVARRR